jgi:predicted nucleotidyltransferase component of viral defense system
MDLKYLNQVSFLLRILPEIERFPNIALHGGTAINLFHHDMPRLSVDIDLTYIPFSQREKDLESIRKILKNLGLRLLKTIPEIKLHSHTNAEEDFKLICRLGNSQIKVEVNTINRGLISEPEIRPLCSTVQTTFKTFMEMRLVPVSQLFGGKIVAALDRQHPRDLFDTKKLLDRNGMNNEIMAGFLFCLLSSKRPIHEILQPVFIDQKNVIDNQFKGMANEPFTYEMFESERKRLLEIIFNKMTLRQKNMILSLVKCEPEWLYGDWSHFPGIKWKIDNLKTLKMENPMKYKLQIEKLERLFFKE